MFIACLLLILLPMITGLFFVSRSRSLMENMLFSWTAGFTVLLTLFELVYLPALYMHWPLHRLCQIFLILALLLALSAITSFMLYLKKNGYKSDLTSAKASAKGKRWLDKSYLIWIPVFGLILFQTYMSSAYMHVDDDDAYYVASATTSVYTDTIAEIDVYTGEPTQGWNMRYVLSPYPTYLAMVSYFSNCHAATLSHVLYPIVFIPIAYGVYFLLAGVLFVDKNNMKDLQVKKAGFMILICIINLFGSYASYSVSSFLLLRIWQGKAVVCSIMIPALFYLYMEQMKKAKFSNNILLFTMATSMGVLSSMGIFLAPFIIGVLSIASVWESKKMSYLLGAVVSIIPCLCLGVLYILVK